MSNYVYNRILCSKRVLDEAFIDYYPFGKEERYDPPYISLNKLLGANDWDEYCKKFGAEIIYGGGFEYKRLYDDTYVILFQSKSYYPIVAIVTAIEKYMDEIVWYCVQDNELYISKFSWGGESVVEDVLDLEVEDYYKWDDWMDKNEKRFSYEDSDGAIWHYDYENRKDWKRRNCKRLLDDYFECYFPRRFCRENKHLARNRFCLILTDTLGQKLKEIIWDMHTKKILKTKPESEDLLNNIELENGTNSIYRVVKLNAKNKDEIEFDEIGVLGEELIGSCEREQDLGSLAKNNNRDIIIELAQHYDIMLVITGFEHGYEENAILKIIETSSANDVTTIALVSKPYCENKNHAKGIDVSISKLQKYADKTVVIDHSYLHNSKKSSDEEITERGEGLYKHIMEILNG